MSIVFFNNEERVLINNICKNEKLAELKKAQVEVPLLLSLDITSDEMMASVIQSTLDKVQAMTEEEWSEMKMKVPFPVAMSPEDEISEIPAE